MNSEFSANANKPNKRALLFGINYINDQGNSLTGCWNDANLLAKLLQKWGYKEENIIICTDEPKNVNTSRYPTRENILTNMSSFVSSAKSGDILFVSYSGHGNQVSDKNGDERDKKDECIYSCKLEQILDDELKVHLIDRVPKGVSLTCIFDCCNSGTCLDLEYRYISSKGVNVRENSKPLKTGASVLCISGCRDEQTSAETSFSGKRQGALTWHFVDTMKKYPKNWTWRSLITHLEFVMHRDDFEQVPQLTVTNVSLIDKQIAL